ncbi:hypothetical protein ACFU53_13630 [Streptomyces sp. NPDC057474]|uniref:hypothetical protein n=1 Tax=Streptomyces sp. NPDC057474 TaxID=3346144 RepID=UPI00369AB1BE
MEGVSKHRQRDVRRWATGLAALTAAFAAVVAFLAPTAAANTQKADAELIYASAGYGYGGATFDWTGPGRASNIDLIVSDWGCDSNPVYAYFRVTRTNGGVWFTDTKRWDYSGCDTGDNTTYNDLSLSDGYNIAYLQVVICVRNGGCTTGGTSGRNPNA